MASLVGIIKQIVRDYLGSVELSDVMYATYSGTGILIDGHAKEVPAAFVDIPLSLQQVTAKMNGTFEGDCLTVEGAGVTKITLKDAEVTIARSLVAGDRVMVVKQHGGKRYSIIDKIGG